LAHRKANIILLDSNHNDLNKTIETLKAKSNIDENNIHSYVVDFFNEDNLKETAKQINTKVGFIYMVIIAHNTSNFSNCGSILKTDSSIVIKQFTASYTSHLWTIQQFIKPMIKHKRGHFVTISNACAIYDMPLYNSYSICKTTECKLIETLREELAVQNLNEIKTTVVFGDLLDNEGDKIFENSYIIDSDMKTDHNLIGQYIIDGVVRNRPIIFLGSLFKWRVSAVLKYIYNPRVIGSLLTYKAKVNRRLLNYSNE
jgi:short-subunit dehydrogenase